MPRARNTSPTRRRRAPVVWDHRKDNYVLLAIFSQLNVRAVNYNQLSDMLGHETYSASVLERRFRELRQIATAVMEDRQALQTDASQQGSNADSRNSVAEAAFQTPAPSPVTPTPTQRPERIGAPEPTPHPSNATAPTPPPRNTRAKTAPPRSQGPDSTLHHETGSQPPANKPSTDAQLQTSGRKRKHGPGDSLEESSFKKNGRKGGRNKRRFRESNSPARDLPGRDMAMNARRPPGPKRAWSPQPKGTHMYFEDGLSIENSSGSPARGSSAQYLRESNTRENLSQSSQPMHAKPDKYRERLQRVYEAIGKKAQNDFIFASTVEH